MSDLFRVVNGERVKLSNAEKEARLAEVEASQIEQSTKQNKDKKDRLKSACETYEKSWIDRNMQSEFDLSRALYEGGNATPEQLPKAASVGQWKEGLWVDYLERKTALLAGEEYSLDFSNNDPLEYDFYDLRGERQAFLGSL